MKSIAKSVAVATLMLILAAVQQSGSVAQDFAVRSAIARGREQTLRAARRAVILFTGDDSLRTKVMEDALALELMNAGMEVVSRSQVETLIAEKMSEAMAGKEGTEQKKEGTEQKPESASRPFKVVGAVSVAKEARANIVLIGTMLEDHSVFVRTEKRKEDQVLSGPIVMVGASIQVVGVETDTVLMVLVGEWTMRSGLSISGAASVLASPLKEAVRR